MGIFSKNINSDEFEKVMKKITELSSRLEELFGKIATLETNQSSLRGLVNRKFGGVKEEAPGLGESQSLNNPVILPYDGHFK